MRIHSEMINEYILRIFKKNVYKIIIENPTLNVRTLANY